MDTLETVIVKIKRNQDRLGIELNPPASEEDIQQLEQALGRPLPPDIAAFYRHCNGFETNEALWFKFNSIEWILKFSSRLSDQRFELADYMISSDTWDVVLNPNNLWQYRITNSNHGTDVEVTLTSSLPEFIGHYFTGESCMDLYDWYEAEKLKQQPGNNVR